MDTLLFPGDDKDWSQLEADNLAHWNDCVPIHVKNYSLDALRADPTRLATGVVFDLPRLGRLDGLDVVHLQCHIGSDTLSLARLGARSTTGLDFSQPALDAASALFASVDTAGRFVCSSVYDAPAALDDRYDLVYTGIGAIGWLDSVERWAAAVAGVLRPGGRFFMREGHPMLWAIDETNSAQDLVVALPYFHQREPLTIDGDGTTYVGDGSEKTTHNRTHSWNYGLGEIIGALMRHGLVLDLLEEHDVCDWQALPWMIEAGDGFWKLPSHRERLPLTYTLSMHLPV